MKKNYAATTDISYHEGSGETYETVAYDRQLWNDFKDGKFKYSQNGAGYLARGDADAYLPDMVRDEEITEEDRQLILDNVVEDEFFPIEFCDEHPDIVEALNLFDYDECDIDEEYDKNLDGEEYTFVSFWYDWD